ncbi:hypothetical protein Cde04nite_31640 [Cellulomonas denverensis]|nr:hypothetical protein Cde04nite_31640 [Cellulomonas denverensis]
MVGPVAADLLAPWESPQHTVVWTDRLVDLTAAGCVPAPADQATVTLAVVDDPRALRGLDRGELHVAHPWRVWVSLALAGETQAADHLREKLTRSGTPGGALT